MSFYTVGAPIAGSMSELRSVRTPPWMTLDPDERVLLRASPSTNLLMAGVVGGFFLITLSSLPFIAAGAVDAGRRTTFALTGVVVAVVVWLFLRINRREYAVTDKRVAVAVGLRGKAVQSVGLDRLRDVSLEQSRLQRWLRVGTLRFDAGDEELAFYLVGSPQFVYDQVRELTREGTTVAGSQPGRGSPT